VIYNKKDLLLPDDLRFDTATVPDFAKINLQEVNSTEPEFGAQQAYVANIVTASDSNRMRDEGSNEAADTQAWYQFMNQRYTNTNWGTGNSLRIVLEEQVQNANIGGAPTSNFQAYLPRVADWKRANRPGADNVQGITSFLGGGVIGVAYIGTMCNSDFSVGINNVGFTFDTSDRGLLVAHECGHNFNMQHDEGAREQPGPTVMNPFLLSAAQVFSPPSVNDFINGQGPFGGFKQCL
jgi:hypothetical protein